MAWAKRWCPLAQGSARAATSGHHFKFQFCNIVPTNQRISLVHNGVDSPGVKVHLSIDEE